MKPVVIIVGPTASGKSRVAMHLAQILQGEIVNADSRQVYRFMDIGTAKPSLQEREEIPHHLFDMVNPDENFSLALYQEMVYRTIERILECNRIPLLVGGSGQYVWSVVEGWKIPQVPPSPEFRDKLERRASEEGTASLYQELREIDPVSASRIHPHNVRRIIRALEVYHLSGIPFSHYQQKEPSPYSYIIIGLTMERGELYRCIDERVDRMMSEGLMEEVRELLKRGYSIDLPSMSSVGYKQLGMYLQSKSSLAEAVQRIKFETHHLARRQYTWFRLSDKRIRWFDTTGTDVERTASAVIRHITDTGSAPLVVDKTY